jgi:hypothetical protein
MDTLPTAAPNQGPAADPSPRSCGNDPLTLTVPTFPLKASTPGITKNLDIRMENNGTHLLLNFGDNSSRANFNDPLLARALVGLNGAYDKARNVWNVGAAKTVGAIIQNYDDASHPVSTSFSVRSCSIFSMSSCSLHRSICEHGLTTSYACHRDTFGWG